MLGSQTLDVLRDVLNCTNDANLASLGQSRPSAYLYIEGVFYLDTRHPNSTDLSQPIRRFLASKGVSAPKQPPEEACEGRVLPEEEISATPAGERPCAQRYVVQYCTRLACTGRRSCPGPNDTSFVILLHRTTKDQAPGRHPAIRSLR